MNYKLKSVIVWISLIFVLAINMQIFYLFYVNIGGLGSDGYFRNNKISSDSVKEIFKIESNFRHDIVNLLQQLYDERLKENQVFLIDHQMLKDYMTPLEVDTLIERKHLPDNYRLKNYQKKNFVSFGIFHSNLDNIKENLVDLISIGWTVKVITVNGKFVQTFYPIEPLHIFLIKGRIVVQLVVFYPKNNYLWIGAFPNHTVQELSQQLKIDDSSMIQFGRHDAIYDPILLQYQKYLSLPQDVAYFVQQYASSRLVQCNQPAAYRFSIIHRDYLVNSKELNGYRSSLIETIKLMKLLSKWLLLDIWIFSDALLSWYRNCGPVIPLKNFEFTLFAEHINVNDFNLTERLFELLKEELDNQMFINEILGDQSKGIEYRLETKRKSDRLSSVNLIPSFRNNHSVLIKKYSFIGEGNVLETNFAYPFSDICSAEYAGEKVLVPCKSLQSVQNEYGPSWTVPITEWDNVFKPHNRINQTLISIDTFMYYQADQSNPGNNSNYIRQLMYWAIYFVSIVLVFGCFKYAFAKKKQR